MAATKALDSMYRLADTPSAVRTALRFATIAVDQGGGCTRRKPNLRAVLQSITGLEGWSDHAGRDQIVEMAGAVSVPRGDKFGDNPPMSSD